MGEGLKQMFREVSSSRVEDDEELGEFSSLSGDSDESDMSSSSDVTDDATSSPLNSSPNSSSSSSSSLSALHLDLNGPLHELSSLVSQLPIKRGLSKYYQGKSQSFSSFSDVRCVADLAKKETPYRRKMKACKSYAGELDESHKSYYAPGPYDKTRPKKAPRGSCASLIARTGKGSIYFCSGKPPTMPMQKNFSC